MVNYAKMAEEYAVRIWNCRYKCGLEGCMEEMENFVNHTIICSGKLNENEKISAASAFYKKMLLCFPGHEKAMDYINKHK